MIVKDKLCKCGCRKSGKIWKNGMLKSCFFKLNPQKPLKSKKKSINKVSKKQEKKNIEKKEWLEELHQWEFDLFDKQKDKKGYCFCFESGEMMHESFYKLNLCIYSHILPKGMAKYKKYAMEEWNVKIVKPYYHTLFENRSEKAVKQLELEKELKKIYG